MVGLLIDRSRSRPSVLNTLDDEWMNLMIYLYCGSTITVTEDNRVPYSSGKELRVFIRVRRERK